MKVTRGITLGFLVGAVLGLLIYLRLQEDKRRGRKTFLRMQFQAERQEPPEPEPIEIQRRPSASGAPEAPEPPADNLEQIDGIGPAYAKRLAGAGIETFDALARSSPDILSEAVGGRVSSERLKAWISQAKKLK